MQSTWEYILKIVLGSFSALNAKQAAVASADPRAPGGFLVAGHCPPPCSQPGVETTAEKSHVVSVWRVCAAEAPGGGGRMVARVVVELLGESGIRITRSSSFQKYMSLHNPKCGPALSSFIHQMLWWRGHCFMAPFWRKVPQPSSHKLSRAIWEICSSPKRVIFFTLL